jgi:2-alkyl-3-oxoalkanoate reductase
VTDVLITGGNGFVGRHLVEALQARGDRVRVLALPEEDTAWLQERGVAVHRGDIRDPATLTAPMRDAEGVLHLAAMMDVWRPLEDYRAVNVTGTANVCNAALRAGVGRLVHMSSSSVYGVVRGGPVTEEFPLRPFPDPYPVTKAEGDALVQRLIAVGLPAVIVRPDQIFGPGDRLHFGRLADRLRAGRGIVVGSGANTLPLLYVSDAVRGLLLALDHESAVGQAYNITNDRPLTQEGFYRAIAEDVGGRAPRVHVPLAILDLAARIAERTATMSRSPHRPPVTRLGVSFLGTNARFSIGKARRALGYGPRVDLREGIRLTAAWYRDQLGDSGIPPHESEEDAQDDDQRGRDRDRRQLGHRGGDRTGARPAWGQGRAGGAPRR